MRRADARADVQERLEDEAVAVAIGRERVAAVAVEGAPEAVRPARPGGGGGAAEGAEERSVGARERRASGRVARGEAVEEDACLRGGERTVAQVGVVEAPGGVLAREKAVEVVAELQHAFDLRAGGRSGERGCGQGREGEQARTGKGAAEARGHRAGHREA